VTINLSSAEAFYSRALTARLEKTRGGWEEEKSKARLVRGEKFVFTTTFTQQKAKNSSYSQKHL